MEGKHPPSPFVRPRVKQFSSSNDQLKLIILVFII